MVYVDSLDYKAMYHNCAVCGSRIGESRYAYHARLDAFIHQGCPLTNVYGEDVSTHAMFWGGFTFKKEKDDVSG